MKVLNLNYSRFVEGEVAKELASALEKCPRLQKVSFKLCRINDLIMKELC